MVSGTQLGARQYKIAATIGRGQPRPFVAPNCPRCGAQLCDSHGNPRWEIQGKLTFVCLGGCRKAGRS